MGWVVRALDAEGRERIESRESWELDRRKFCALERRSGLNGLVRESSGSSLQSLDSNDELSDPFKEYRAKGNLLEKSDSGEFLDSASMIGCLPRFPTLKADVLETGIHRGILDDLQMLLEICITWTFQLARFLLCPICVPQPHNPSQKRAQLRNPRGSKTLKPYQNIPLNPKPSPLNPKPSPLNPKPSLNPKRGNCGPCVPVWKHVQTAGDAILASGCPLEVHKVTTADGYIITMHRIPRKNSKKAVFFLHGMLDSAICWVAGGVTESPAFEAYNQGLDVWLGDSRNSPPRRHVDRKIQRGLEFWAFTVNELGQMDVQSFLDHINVVKNQELGSLNLDGIKNGNETDMGVEFELTGNGTKNCTSSDFFGVKRELFGIEEPQQNPSPFLECLTTENSKISKISEKSGKKSVKVCKNGVLLSYQGKENNNKLYTLKAVGHSLGAASLLIYTIMSEKKGLPMRLDKLILLAPAGFHRYLPPMAFFSYNFLKPLAWFLTVVLRLPGFGVQMPSGLARLLAFKFLHDFKRMPALGLLAQRFMDMWTSGDGSAWNRAVRAPHYISRLTPGISLHTGLHIVQWFHTGEFSMYDYGNKWANLIHYGSTGPLNLAQEYHRIKIPLHIMSGKNDGVISCENVKLHVEAAEKLGVDVTYREFDHSHLHFAGCMKNEVRCALLDSLQN